MEENPLQNYIIALTISVIIIICCGFYFFRTIPTPEQIVAQEQARQIKLNAEHQREIESETLRLKGEAEKPPEVRSAEVTAKAIDKAASDLTSTYIITKFLFSN